MNQLSLDFSSDRLTTNTPSNNPIINAWRGFLALPVITLASAWVAFTGDGKSPCKTICRLRGRCLIRKKCIAYEAYDVGLSWRFGDIEYGEASPVGIAREGGTYGGAD
ncbi:hypothetical protein [Pelobacter propionicus]|nr:hypothetical protein [Pelobacter propionicus]